MKSELSKLVIQALKAVGVKDPAVSLEYPENTEHGDFSTNAALAYSKQLKTNPRKLAEDLISELKKALPDFVGSLEIAGAGFINFKIKPEAFAKEVVKISKGIAGPTFVAKQVMVEYTQPNPFKEFHIGHLMSNAIGESIARLFESQGNKVIRANWQGDVGPHVAKALWGARNMGASPSDYRSEAEFWGKAYAFGAGKYEDDPAAKVEINEINKKVYERSDPELNKLYDSGRKACLDAFEVMYKRLGTKFDEYFFESKEGKKGIAVVEEFLKKGIFEKSEGAVVFKGEDHGLHTRVFINSQGLPTYETKEIGLNKEKFKKYPDLDLSVVETGNEQTDYFKVMLKVFSLIDPNIAAKTRHVSHGLMRFSSGKMSSRKGNVITAESLINDVKAMVHEKMAGREFDGDEADQIADAVAIAAIKYSVLRQSPGSDVVFDSVKSISFEGDSGPYLQYATVRANSVIAKSIEFLKDVDVLPTEITQVERLITRFKDIADRAAEELAPQYVANYLIALASAFNNYYSQNQILDPNQPETPYRIALTNAFAQTMTRGLGLLGIKVPKKM